MYKNLIRVSGQTCVDIGRKILPKLEADPRLAPAAAILRPVQVDLEAKLTAYLSAVEAARVAAANRDQADRDLEDRLWEFGLHLLAMVRNNHEGELYLRYFPDGYGISIHELPNQLLEFAGVVLGKLEQESDPKLTSYRDGIREARDAFVAANELGTTSDRQRRDQFEYEDAARRSWVHGLTAARLRALEDCMGDEIYLREIFRPANTRREKTQPPVVVPGGGTDVPVAPIAPQVGPLRPITAGSDQPALQEVRPA